MQDRLSELRDGAASEYIEHPLARTESAPSIDEEHQLKKKKSGLRFRKSKKKEKKVKDAEEVEDEVFMEEFFEFVKSLKDDFLKIQDGICSMETLYSRNIISTRKDQNHEELQHVIDETNCSISRVRNGLIEIAQGNQQLKNNNPDIVNVAEFQIRVNAYNTMRQKFLSLSQEYQDLQVKYKNKQKEKLERQIKIVDPAATEEEIQTIMETGSVQLLMEQTVLDKSNAKESLLKVEQQRSDLLSLEQSIQELHQLFVDMALLVDQQGELINVIETNVNRTVGYTRSAATELKKAQKHSKSARKKMILLITGLIAGIGGIFGGMFAAFR